MTSTQVSPILSEKLTRNHMELLRYKAVIPGLSSQSDNTSYIIWRVSLRRLSECCSIYNKDQSIHVTNKPSRAVEISGIRKDAIHEPIPSHQLFLCVWQNAVTILYIFDHQRVNISLGSMLERFHTMIKGESLWDQKLCEMRVLAIKLYFTVCDHGDHIQHYKLKIEHFGHSLW